MAIGFHLFIPVISNFLLYFFIKFLLDIMMLGKVEKSPSSIVYRGMKATYKQKYDLSDKIKSSDAPEFNRASNNINPFLSSYLKFHLSEIIFKLRCFNFLNTHILRTCTTWMSSLTNDTCLAWSLIVLFTGWFYNNLLLIHKLFGNGHKWRLWFIWCDHCVGSGFFCSFLTLIQHH